MEHTPGPWSVGREGWKHQSVYSASGRFLADVSLFYDDAEANARLIAAAPDLLEALQMLYDETADYITLNHLGDPHHNQSMKLARAAIKKATD